MGKGKTKRMKMKKVEIDLSYTPEPIIPNKMNVPKYSKPKQTSIKQTTQINSIGDKDVNWRNTRFSPTENSRYKNEYSNGKINNNNNNNSFQKEGVNKSENDMNWRSK